MNQLHQAWLKCRKSRPSMFIACNGRGICPSPGCSELPLLLAWSRALPWSCRSFSRVFLPFPRLLTKFSYTHVPSPRICACASASLCIGFALSCFSMQDVQGLPPSPVKKGPQKGCSAPVMHRNRHSEYSHLRRVLRQAAHAILQRCCLGFASFSK